MIPIPPATAISTPAVSTIPAYRPANSPAMNTSIPMAKAVALWTMTWEISGHQPFSLYRAPGAYFLARALTCSKFSWVQ
jgi:hypothetical protein